MTASPEKLQRIVEERGVEPSQALFATFVSALAEQGVMTQGLVNLAAKRMAPTLWSYLKVMGLAKTEGTGFEKLVGIVESFNTALKVGGKPVVEKLGNGLVAVKMGGKTCRYCPKGVGLAEIPGTACPFPRLLENIFQLEGLNAKLVIENRKVLTKEEGYCVFKYKLE